MSPLDTIVPYLSEEHNEIFAEADTADELKAFLVAADVRILSDCRDVGAVFRLDAGCDHERVARLLHEWQARSERRPHRRTEAAKKRHAS